MAEPTAIWMLLDMAMNVGIYDDMQISRVGERTAIEDISILSSMWCILADTLPCGDCSVVCRRQNKIKYFRNR